MKAGLLALVGCLACCVAGLVGSPVAAFGEGLSSGERSGASPLGSSLVIPGSPIEAEQRLAQEEARRSSPEAVAAREESQTKYEGLSSEQAAKLVGEAFPHTIDHSAGTLPPLPAGEQVVGYPADNAAQVSLPEGKHGVVDSLEPVAIETSPGHHEPLNLSLSEVGGVFQPTRSGVGLHIPKQLPVGVQLPGSGVSLTPVDEHGSALGGSEGVVDGATVLYANTQTDADTVVKPLASGFEEDTLLRSVNSPSRLSFRVGLPSGASLVPAKDGSGTVDVVDEGSMIAMVPTPTAQDAEGTVVPVSMSVSGDTLVVSVNHAGSYRYPIEVDPTVAEGSEIKLSTWGFYTENASIFKVERPHTEEGFYYAKDIVSKSVATGERAFFYYPTQGLSRIYAVTASTSFEGYSGSKMENVLGIENVHTGKPEVSQSWIENYGANPTLCSEPGCATGTVTESNDKSEVFYQQDEREANEWGGGTARLSSATVDIVQEVGPSASFIPIEKWLNNLGNNQWLGLSATDPGLGISGSEWTSPSNSEWKRSGGGCASGVQCEECYAVSCGKLPISENLQGLPEGEDAIEAVTKDPVGLSATSKTTVKIDNQAPYNLSLTGFPATHEISFGRYVVKVSATDGTSAKSSGVASIALAIDGKEVGTPRGACLPGPCTGTGEWSVNGEEYAAGKHTFTMTATDGAGNVKKEEFALTIESSEAKGVGPGSVDLTSGAYMMEATDVAIASPGSGLTIRRSYNSRHLTAGAEGPLGPQWSGLGLGGTQSLAKLPTGSMLLTAANGRQAVFAKEGTGFVSPTGDANMTLKEEGSNTFILSEQNGTKTTFTLPSGGSGTLFTPSAREEPGSAGALKYTFQTVGGITEPIEALAPPAAGITCTTLVKGCRALTFNYATSTTATGENESEWGDYTGHLTRIYFTAWDPSKSELTTTTVAQYSYDKKGRLRAEWDPRVSPSLKTMYGYDSEGHVVSLTPPGQETWGVTYTSIASDPNTGRLVKVARALASAALWNGQALANTAVPALSGTAIAGNRMGVSTGTWTNGPVTYGYQWERCNSSGGECAPITGAINPNYTPVEADVGHTLAAVVTAINGDGSLTATSAASGLVSASGAPVYVSSTPGKPAGYKAPDSVAITSTGNVWVADTGDNQIVEFNEKDEFLRRIGTKGEGTGQFSSPTGITVDLKGNVWVADTSNNRIQELNEKGEYLKSFGSKGKEAGQLKAPYGVVIDSKGNVWVADTGNERIQEFNEKGEYLKKFAPKQFLATPTSIAVDASGNVWFTTGVFVGVEEFNEKGEYIQKFGSEGTGNGQFKEPQGIAVKEKHVWVADTKNNRIQEFGEKGEYQKQFGTKGEGNGQLNLPAGLLLDSKGNVWVADTSNNRIQEFNEKGEYKAQFDNQGTSIGELSYPGGVAIDPKGNVWAVNLEKKKIAKFNEKGEYLWQFGTEGTGAGQFLEPIDVATDSKGNLWVVDSSNQRVEEFNENGTYLSQFGSQGTGNGQFSYPWGIAIDSKGNLWIADEGNNRIEEFNEKKEYLQKFGSEGTGNGQFKAPDGVAVDAKGHVWVSDTYNNRIQEFGEKGEFLKTIGTTGTGNGQFNRPVGISVDSSGNVWVADTENNRVQELNEKGEYQTSFGTKGEGPGQFAFRPVSYLALDSKGNMWVTDTGNSREQHWQIITKVEAEAISPAAGSTVVYGVPVSGTGAPNPMTSAELEKWGQKDNPSEATAIFPPDEPQNTPASDYRRATVFYLDNHGRTVNVASPGGAISTSEYNSTDDVVRSLSPGNRAAALKEGSKSAEVSKVLDSESTYNSEGTELQSTLGPQHTVKLASGTTVEARDHKQYSYDEGAPSEGGPYRLVTKVTDGAQYSGKEEDVRTSTTSYSGQENLGWKLHKPTSVTTDPSGLKLTQTTMYEASTGNIIETRSPMGESSGTVETYSSQFGSEGTGNGQFKHPGDVAVDSKGNLWVLDKGNNRVEEFNGKGEYQKAFGSEGTGNGQLKGANGLAVDSKGNVWVIDTGNSRVEEFNEKGEYQKVFGSSGSGNGQFSTPEGIAVDAHGNVWVSDTHNGRLQEFNEKGEFLKAVGSKGSGAGQFGESEGIAIDSKGNVWIADWSNNRVEEFNEKGEYVKEFGAVGSGNGQLKNPYGIGVDTKGNVWVADTNNYRVEEFNEKGEYAGTFGTKGTGAGQFSFSWPIGVAVDAKGDIWVTDSGDNRVEKWIAGEQGGSESAHDTQAIYYTAAANSKYPGCGEHAEWANLRCETKPVAQPGTSGLPELPVSTVTYNLWDEPEKTMETVGTKTRTKTATYDAAGRVLTAVVSSPVGTAVPTVTYEYSPETSALTKQRTTVEGKTKAISVVYNTLGQLTSYTDADENTSTFTYDVDGRMETTNDGKGIQTDTYDTTTGLLAKLVDSAAGTFTASYDTEGHLITEGLPNGMNADYTFNQTGAPTKLEYVKTTHCTEKCTWFSDTSVPSIHGQMLSHTSTLSNQNYTYDNAGRLTQVQNTPVGKGCTTRIYAYDADTNRLSLTTREPNSKGECAIEGGASEAHSYDSADRLTDTGAKYDEFGNITNLSASDAGGSELTSSFYATNQLASQTQNGQTIGYNLDPTGRTRETVSTGKIVATEINHYAGPSQEPAWSGEISGHWTRNIPGIGGSLAAVQKNGEAPVLQLTNLHGDVIATAYVSETATALASTADTTEYGVPATSAPPKYSWLGAHELPTELPSGVIAMGARSYVPQLGRFLQTDPISGGSANAYAYTFGDPVNASDPSGAYTVGGPSQALISGTAELASEAAAEQAAINAAARAEAERKATEASSAFASTEEGGEEWGEEEEEEGEEYAAWHKGAKSSQQEAHIEEGTLWQPFGNEARGSRSAPVPLCAHHWEAGAKPCTRYASSDDIVRGVKVAECEVLQASNRHDPHNRYYYQRKFYAHCQYLYRHYGRDVKKVMEGKGESNLTRVVACSMVSAGLSVVTLGASAVVAIGVPTVGGGICGLL